MGSKGVELPTGDADQVVHFAEEREGWKGYIEWEAYPEKKKAAHEILKRHKFPKNPEYQLKPLPDTNPILEGTRFKLYHEALGLQHIPEISWEYVKKEKSPDMLHVLRFPYNGEPPRERLVSTPITPNTDHFVRNHGGIPEIPASAWTLDITGLVNTPKRLTLADLQNPTLFPRRSTTVTLQCSGTRRLEQIAQYPGDGDELINAPWREGAIGTARYEGVDLKKVIKHCGGLAPEATDIEFAGADTYFKKGAVGNYIVSVPWRKVQRKGEVLLVWSMNGEALPRIHGAPVRVLVCGYIGARSVKWVYAVRAIAGPSRAPVQRKEYLYYSQQVGKQNVGYSNGFSIQDMPVSSAIMAPEDGAQVVHEGKIRLKGWAYSGGGHWPVRVEVSPDGGHVWYEVPWENLSDKFFYAWRTWEMDVPVEAEGWLEFCVRCWDDALNTQPTFVRSTWNWDLHVTSSCHRIKIYSINRSRPATVRRLKYLEEHDIPLLPIMQPLEIELESDEEYEREMEKRGGRDPVE